MKNFPLVSIVIAAYNAESTIEETLKSVFNQTYPNIEIVVVDDYSNDHSIDVINNYKNNHDNISFYQNPSNKGCGFTKRRAASLGKGSIMGFLDPDDTLLPFAVELMVQAHNSDNRLSLVTSSHFVCDEQLQIKREAYGACAIPANENYLTYGKGVTQFSSFKTKYYQQTEGINEGFKRAVDQDLYYKLEEVGNLSYIPQPLYKYRIHEGGISNLKNLAKARYWMVKAKEAAYYRRLKLKHIKNISQSHLKSWWSILYATKAGVALGTRKYGAAVCWLGKSIITSPVDRFTWFKIQSIMIHLKPRWIK